MFWIYLGCFLLIVYYLITKNNSYWESKEVPYEKPVFLFGSFYNLGRRKEHISEIFRSIYNKYKSPYVGFFTFTKPALMIRSPEVIKRVLVKDFDKFLNKTGAANESVDPIAFHTLAAARDSTWKSLRAKISPVFTSGKMKLMFPLMKQCGQDLQSYFLQRSGQTIEVGSVMKKYSVDIISSCAFGFNSNCLKNEDSEVLYMAGRLLDFRSFVRNFSLLCFFFIPSLTHILRLTFLDSKASSYFIDIFKNVVQERKKLQIKRNDLIDLLNNLKENETATDAYKFDDLKMAAQAILFFTAGNDTTSITTTFALYELALNQEIQERLRQEITETYNREGDFTYESIQEMKYLDMFLNETLRKYPLTTFLNREAGSDYTFEETGLHLEKGTPVYIPVAGLHFDPEYFPDPEKFDPERFSDENKKSIKPYTFLPFGDGPRNCIGQRFALLNAKSGLAHLIKDYKLEPTEVTDIPIQFEKSSVFLQNRNGVKLRVTKIR